MPHSLTEVPLRQWRLLSLSRHRLLLLDYDGTLAPLQVARDHANPMPRSIELVRQIAEEGHARVAILSGRPVRELQQLLPDLRVDMVGEHGWEQYSEATGLVLHPLPDGVEPRLEAAAARLSEQAPAARLERKRSSLAVHTRGLPAGEAESITELARSLWQPLAEGAPLELCEFNGGLELISHGRDKGVAARALLEQEPAGTFATYLGDDATDEDVFEALLEIGFCVRVGGPNGPTLASGWIQGPEAVADFLEEWLRVVKSPSAS